VTAAIDYKKGADDIVTLTMDMPGQSANTMNQVFRDALAAAVGRLEEEREGIKGVILTSAKKTFFAGGDLNNLLAARREDAPAMFERCEAMKSLLRRIEKLGRPVVAAINGTALGGGFELCLACHARFAVNDPTLQLGLPETTLGLMPGAGGVVRLVRMMGVEAAMPWLVDGTTVKPEKALELKWVDGLGRDIDEVFVQARQWILANPEAQQPWDRKGHRIPGASERSPAPLAYLRSAPLQLARKNRGLYPAPETAMSAAIESATVDFDTASRIESRYLVHLATHPVAKNLITTFFFQMNDIRSGKSRPEGVPKASFRRVGVLGAGLMGSGIAQVCAERGMEVVLKDVSGEAAAAGKARVEKTLTQKVQKGRMSEQKMAEVLARIRSTGDAADLQGCEIVVEAVFEKRELKAQVTREAAPRLAPGGIFASNTSTLPITGLAAAAERPANFIGLHFFSPVDRMPLVEIITGEQTSPETLARSYDFVQELGKTPIVVRDSRGFFTSRVFGTFTKEGAALLAEGVPAAEIENAAVAVGMPVGPLAVMDETSMALSWSVRQQTIADLAAEGKPVPQHPGWDVIDRMANQFKRPGRAGGGGFYEYPPEGRKHLWPGLCDAFPERAGAVAHEDVRDRLLYVQAIEAIRCMEEGVIQAAREANVGSIQGIGFPRWTGGALQYVNSVGLQAFADRARQLADRYGERFEPPALLLQRAREGGRFE
jgi:3-hydroxyacyl-CoA dehydrogenase/enoyl-CoA hydratase/3-hydroxybutyryl-CoA epimerase